MKDIFLQKYLDERKQNANFRSLSSSGKLIDFCSNDYLGFARCKELKNLIDSEIIQYPTFNFSGSTGSRLLTGNSQYAEELETFIAGFHKAEAGLIFNSGYDANIGLISSVAQKNDIILYDELSHASIYDGIRLSKAESFPFRHNDLIHLEERQKFFRNNRKENSSCFIIVESVYSMGGDFAPLKEIVSLCEEYKTNLIVDEAHATGIFGSKGEGRVVELNLYEKVFARVHTFGKALGCHGAIVLGSQTLRNFLINFSRSFIYTTALPIHNLIAIKSSYELLKKSKDKILHINNLIKIFKQNIEEHKSLGFGNSFSPVQYLVSVGNENTKRLSSLIQRDGFDVRPILSPTVPKGKERIRICLHTFNTEQDLNGLLTSIVKNCYC
ncbi:MAG: pyridoxal phosphate-dependent aminotransferase family protein [Bacteroidota bacterium]